MANDSPLEYTPAAMPLPKASVNSTAVSAHLSATSTLASTNAFASLADCEAEMQWMLTGQIPPAGIVHIKIFDPQLAILSSRKTALSVQQFFLDSRAHRISAVLLDDRIMRRDFHHLMPVLKTFSHAVEIFVLQTHRDRAEDAFVVADRKHLLWRPSRERWMGNAYRYSPDVAQSFDERFEEMLESSERVGLFTLGL